MGIFFFQFLLKDLHFGCQQFVQVFYFLPFFLIDIPFEFDFGQQVIVGTLDFAHLSPEFVVFYGEFLCLPSEAFHFRSEGLKVFYFGLQGIDDSKLIINFDVFIFHFLEQGIILIVEDLYLCRLR